MKPQDNESCLVREPSLLVRQLVRLRIQTFLNVYFQELCWILLFTVCFVIQANAGAER